MRACLLALLMLFCLPLQWAGAATGDACAHKPCAQLHAGVSETARQFDADKHAEGSHALNPHCGSCHAGALALLASGSFSVGDTRTTVPAGKCSWTQVLLIERPERPQWTTLA